MIHNIGYWLVVAWIAANPLIAVGQENEALAKKLRPFLEVHCYTCHDQELKKGGLDLSALPIDFSTEEGMAKWVRIYDRVAKGEMPPNKRSAPPKEEKEPFLTALAEDLTETHQAQKGAVLSRLNREEYENTLRDLLGVPVELKELLPEDGSAHGFDTVGEALDLSPIHLRQYMKAADKALQAAVRKEPQPKKQVVQFDYTEGRSANFIGRLWLKRPDGAVVFFTGGYPPATLEKFKTWADGIYRIRITGYGYQSETPVAFGLYFGQFGRNPDSHRFGHYELASDKPNSVEVEVYLRKGDTLRITPYGLPGGDLRKVGPKAYKGPGLAVQKVEVEGPIISSWPGKGHRVLFGELPVKEIEPANPAIKKRKYYKPKFEIRSNQPVADAEKLLRGFLPLAFRRPVEDTKVLPYLNLVKSQLAKGDDFERALLTGYTAALCSPDFLLPQENPGKLDDYALASRLSYFLWSSMPDADLLELARQKKLSDPKILREQTERLLKDTKAQRFTKNFVGQWLDLRNIDFTVPDKRLYPEFDDMLEEAMVRETEGFFNEILHNDLSLLNFLDSDWAILYERLAVLYGIEGV